MFFFEKKNQKTFAPLSQAPTQTGPTGATRKEQKFFGSFFQKRTFLHQPGEQKTHGEAPIVAAGAVSGIIRP
jgi:hypothetical protein